MEIYKKLNNCRKAIKATKLTKEGHNNFSNYDYFTPSQVEKLVFDACQENELMCKFDLKRTDLGLVGELLIIDLNMDGTEGTDIRFQMATDIPEIKATNIAQQLGGAMTYTERYLKMTAFGITDNTLDPDTPQKPKKEKKEDDKPWLNKFTNKQEDTITDNYTKVLKAISDGYTIDQVREKYKVSKAVEKLLKEDS